MTSVDLFRRIVAALNEAGIPFMLTGSFAGSWHGMTRATQDVDLVIAPDEDQLRKLVTLLPDDQYYVDPDAALDALRRSSQFNVIHLATGWKIDLIVRRDRPFSRQEFDRRETIEFMGVQLAVATIEDVIIAKLEWAKMGASQRQIEDVAALIRLRGDEIDLAHVESWVDRLGLGDQWTLARQMASRD